MLLFVKCHGQGINETMILVPEASASWRSVREQIAHLRPHYLVRVCLFSGSALTDADLDKTLTDLRIVKESTIQFSCSIKDDDDEKLGDMPPMCVSTASVAFSGSFIPVAFSHV